MIIGRILRIAQEGRKIGRDFWGFSRILKAFPSLLLGVGASRAPQVHVRDPAKHMDL
jgi:hypothetical protein